MPRVAAKPSPVRLAGPRPDKPDSDGLVLHTDMLGDRELPGGVGHCAELDALAARAVIYATRASGDGTRQVYRSAWRGYEACCR